MTTFLPSAEELRNNPPPAITPRAVGEVSSPWEVMKAAAKSEALETDYWYNEGNTRSTILRQLANRLGPEVYGPLLPESALAINGVPENVPTEEALSYVLAPAIDAPAVKAKQDEFAQNLFRKIKEMQSEDHSLFSDISINSIAALDDEVKRQRQAEYRDAQDTLEMGGTFSGVSEFLGRGAVAMTDQTSLAMMPLGLEGSIGRVVVSEAVLGGLGEAAILPRMQDQAEKLDIADPDATTQIAMGMVFGGALPLAGHTISRGARLTINGVGRYLDLRAGRNLTPDVPPDVPPGQTPFEAEAIFRQTENSLKSDGQLPNLPAPSDAVAWRNAIASVESRGSGDYGAIGPVMSSGSYAGDRAYGRYQIMGRNIPEWSRRHLGREVTIEEFMANPDIQDAIFDGEFGSYVQKYGSPQDAASVWFTGQPLSKGGSRSDGFITGNEYVRRFNKALGDPDATAPRTSSGTGAGADIPTGTRAGYTAPDQVVTPSGTRIDVAYEVVDASLLTRASGDLQPRDRTRAASDAQITQIAAELDPARLMPSAEADRGAPIIGPDNVIESGNGRVAAIQRAAPDRKAAYRAAIIEAGFDIPEGVQEPVLVARRKSDLSPAARVDFVNDANTSSIARMSATEQAAQDARALSSHTMAQYDPAHAIGAPDNTPFTRSFLANLPANERAGLTTAEGRLNLDGERRLKQALFARAYGAPDLIAKHAEAADPAMRSLIDALAEAAPNWSALRADIEAGLIKSEMDLTDHLLDAVRLIGDARKAAAKGGTSTAGAIDDALAQISLDGQIHPLTEALVQIFRKGDRVRPDREITELLTGYTDEARIVGKTDAALFDDELSSGPMEVLNAIQKETDLFAPGGPGTRPRDEALYRQPNRSAAQSRSGQAGAPLDTRQIPEQAYIDGAQSEGSIAADAQAIEDLRSQLQAMSHEASKVEADLADMKSRQPFTTIEELYAKHGDAPSMVEAAQADLSARGRAISEQTGIEFKDPGPKDRGTVEDKMARKSYVSATQLTDTARGGFILKSVEDAETVISALRESGEIVDEGWSITNTGYLDRKVLVRAENGVIAEVQLWIDQVFQAKKARGHAIYTERRSGNITAEKAAKLREEEVSLYAAALREAGVNPSKLLGKSNTPKVDANSLFNSSSDPTTAAVSSTSKASTGVQSPPFSSKAKASPLPTENNTAGRPSQFANTMSDTSTTRVSALRSEVKKTGDFEIKLPDGQTYRASDILDDLEADSDVADIINLCNPKGGA